MTTTSKVIGALVGALLLLAIFAFLNHSSQPGLVSATAPQGATYLTGNWAGVTVNLAAPGTNATSSSILNNSTNDYYVTAIKVGCEGVGSSNTAYVGGGLSALTLKVSTSSTAAPAVLANNNLVGVGAMTIGTSTPTFVEASSTASTALPNTGSSLVANIWPANTYMTFTVNATNTATCTFGVDYISS